MTFKEYYENLTKFYNDNPQAHGFPVYSASDAEGNSYNVVHYTPTLGQLDDDCSVCFNEDAPTPDVVVIN